MSHPGDEVEGSGEPAERRFVWPPGPPTPIPPNAPDAPDSPDPPLDPQTRASLRGGLANDPDPLEQADSRAIGAVSTLLDLERMFLGARRSPIACGPDGSAGLARDWMPDRPAERCPRCAHRVGPFEADSAGCPGCRDRRLPWDRAVTLGDFAGPLREAIHELKFRRWRSVGREVGRALGERLGEELALMGVEPGSCTLVPVPMAYRRRLERGVDHTLELVRGVRRGLGGRAEIVRALGRGHRPTQWSVPMSQRQANVAGAFRARPGAAQRLLGAGRGGPVVVLDDVVTTGATMRAACRALRAGMRRAEGSIRGSGRDGEADRGGRREVWIAAASVTPPPERGRSWAGWSADLAE
ncbi:MAG: ComF family protein [Phycisphaerales bacterium JB037]